ncbi:hypothetical protein [Petrimonas sp.]|uniref:hypothetical protein n=1 Tax=Petrimonas sp. TaxID=2023866 RepID=UPI003F510C1C
MRKRKRHSIIKWFLPILFAAYVSGISLFTHSHVIRSITYVHSHPYKKSEKNQHSHTEKQLILLEYIYQTSITNDVVPEIDVTDTSNGENLLYLPLLSKAYHLSAYRHKKLRAPPAAA